MRISAVIPVLDERDGLRTTLDELPSELRARTIVVDGGSRDGTVQVAVDAGARVLVEPRRGYGRAVQRGISAALSDGADAAVIFDGNGSVRAEDVRRVLQPIADGIADVALGVRPAHALRPLQRLGNRLATRLIALRHGVRFRDLAWIRAMTRDAVARLDLDELGYGWPMQLHLRTAARRLRIAEIGVTPRPRAGRSKVSGTFGGTMGAGFAFLRVAVREWGSS